LALVTGAGSGIGRATAAALAAHGAHVVLVDRDSAALARAAEDIPAAGTFICDVSDERAMERLCDHVLARYGVPDVVVNNAGVGVAGSFLETSVREWRRVLGVNLMGVVHGCRLFGREMVQRGEGGHIVNIASAAAFQPAKDLAAYSASKAAVLMASECLRAELGAHGIGVTAVCPGFVHTNITRTARYVGQAEGDERALAERVTRLYERRNFTPGQVAEEILRAIARDRPVAVITVEARLMRALSRFAPGVGRRLARLDTLPA
jgi:short-subunit dehydrogenase